VDGRQIRRLFNQVISKEEQRKNPKARKLEKTIELAQANCEILLHESNELCKAVVLEKRKRSVKTLSKTTVVVWIPPLAWTRGHT